MNWSAIGSVLLALAVILGAFGAHGLCGKLDAYSLGVYEKAVFYHFLHAFGVLAVPLFAKVGMLSESAASRICFLLTVGILLFSGSLYVLAISGVRSLGAVTPLGGAAFIAAWTLLAIALFRQSALK